MLLFKYFQILLILFDFYSSEERLLSMCEALKNNEVLEELSLANTSMGDFVAANLSAAIESNTKLLKLNIESNNVSPQCLVKIFEVICYFVFYAFYVLLQQKVNFSNDSYQLGHTNQEFSFKHYSKEFLNEIVNNIDM